jgi:hypothetical protein
MAEPEHQETATRLRRLKARQQRDGGEIITVTITSPDPGADRQVSRVGDRIHQLVRWPAQTLQRNATRSWSK